MTALNPCDPKTFAWHPERVSWLRLLPKIIVLPGGGLYANFVLFRIVREMRTYVRLIRKQLTYECLNAASLSQRQEVSTMIASEAARFREGLDIVVRSDLHGLLFKALVLRMESAVNDLGDLADTFALGADEELQSLASAMADVL